MRIAIVGAGPAGLTLARILHVHGIETSVYERDPSRHARSQGGTLDLHPESGQYALEAAGLAEQFHALARSEGEEHKIFSPSGDLLVHHVPDAPGGRPEIDRTDLRDLLAGSLPAATIHWDAKVVAVEERAGGGFRLGLADGTTSECDLLVGADGGGSLLRSRLTDAATAYLSSYTQMIIPDVDRTRPDLGPPRRPRQPLGAGPRPEPHRPAREQRPGTGFRDGTQHPAVAAGRPERRAPAVRGLVSHPHRSRRGRRRTGGQPRHPGHPARNALALASLTHPGR